MGGKCASTLIFSYSIWDKAKTKNLLLLAFNSLFIEFPTDLLIFGFNLVYIFFIVGCIVVLIYFFSISPSQIFFTTNIWRLLGTSTSVITTITLDLPKCMWILSYNCNTIIITITLYPSQQWPITNIYFFFTYTNIHQLYQHMKTMWTIFSKRIYRNNN